MDPQWIPNGPPMGYQVILILIPMDAQWIPHGFPMDYQYILT